MKDVSDDELDEIQVVDMAKRLLRFNMAPHGVCACAKGVVSLGKGTVWGVKLTDKKTRPLKNENGFEITKCGECLRLETKQYEDAIRDVYIKKLKNYEYEEAQNSNKRTPYNKKKYTNQDSRMPF